MSTATLLSGETPQPRFPGELQELLRHSPQLRYSALATPEPPPQSLALGVRELDSVLPEGGLPFGQVTELCLDSGATDWVGSKGSGGKSPTETAVPMSIGAGLGTTIGLWACRAAQQRAALHGSKAWCAFVDPAQTLHAPGVAQAGVELERLLVVCPPLESLERVVIRLAEANSFAVIVVDTLSLTAQNPRGLRSWSKVIRRLALALRSTQAMVLLLTDRSAQRSAPLPVGLRLELSLKRQLECHSQVAAFRGESVNSRVTYVRELGVKVAKHKHGRISEEQLVRLPARQACLNTSREESKKSPLRKSYQTVELTRPERKSSPQTELMLFNQAG